MMILIPVVIGVSGLVGWTIYRKKVQRFGVMTPERKVLLEKAMLHWTDAEKIRRLADVFEKNGLKKEATMLRKRAALRALPNDVRQERRTIWRNAFSWTDPQKVLSLAAAFEKEGATGAAAELRRYAAGLQ